MRHFFDDRVHRIEVLQELRDSYLRQAAQVDLLLQEEFDAPETNQEGDTLPTIELLLHRVENVKAD